MDLAKVPDSDESHWDSLDIFLFTNGQQQTPPRKYHLNADELNKWDATLKTLAQSLYGTTQSTIDLYTIDGQKVTTPIEIINHNAYVAVLPEDKFIHAGYTEYLLKASRSREKRLDKLKKANNNGALQPGPTVNKIGNKEDINVNKLATKVEIDSCKLSIDSATGKLTSSSGDQPISVPQSMTSNRNSIIAKQLDKRINNNSLRKNSIAPNVMTPRTSLKSKENLSRKNLRVSTGRVLSKDPVLTVHNNNVLKTKPRIICKTGKDIITTNDQKTTDDATHISNVKINNVNHYNVKKCLTDSDFIENIINDKELIVVKNPDSAISDMDKNIILDANQTILPIVMPVIEESKNTDLNKEETTLTVTNNCVEKVYVPDMSVNNELSSNNKDKIYSPLMSQDQKSMDNETVLKNTEPTENFIAVIDKGDFIKLNLKIEVKKADAMINAHYNTENNQLNSLKEKSSQVELDEIFVQSQEKKYYTNNKKIGSNDENSKIGDIHCACYDHNFNEIINNINTAIHSDGKKHIFILSDVDFINNLPRCNCGQDMAADTQRDSRKISSSTPIKKVYADTMLLNMVGKDFTPSTKPDLSVTASQAQNSSKNIQEEDQKKQFIGTDNKLFLNEINLNIENLEPKEDEVLRTESLIVRKNVSNITKQLVDNFTQTEWSTILLEARLHDDGRYSFHFPPLRVLNYYFL